MSGIAKIPSPFTVDISRDVSVLSSGGGGGGTYFSGVVAQLPDKGIIDVLLNESYGGYIAPKHFLKLRYYLPS